MNEKKLRGAELDIVVFDEIGKLAKEMSHMYDRWFVEALTKKPMQTCIYCKANEHRHEEYSVTYSNGHPFFHDNLEYLEWLDKQRNG